MTAALYVNILQNNSYKSKLRDNIVFDDVIDYLLSKDLISEKEYLKMWNDKAENIDCLLNTLKNKSPEKLTAIFDVFKSVYRKNFEDLIKEISLEVMDVIHLKGGFPKINKYIPRKEKELEVKKKMEMIKWDNSLVVYGRVGEGKSYLVGECLRDTELVGKHFNNQMFWLNVGELQSKTTVVQPLIRLLRTMAPQKKIIRDVDYLVDKLTEIFKSKKYRKSLVIIDNARSMEVIEIFQKLRCKLVIITHFRKVKNAEFVEIDSGLTLNETVQLFAQYLETSPENLNNSFFDDIKDIHEQCKGHPSTLALLGVVLSSKKEHALVSKCFWNDIKDKIDKGEVDKLGNDDAEVTQRKFHEALKMCIRTIKTDEMKELYYTFAVFPKDANISTEVLEVFWDKSARDVTDIMIHFEDRSLVNSFYNMKKQAYVYVIHDLFLHYLRSETNSCRKEFHRKLVETYMNKYDFHELPDDNYILLFLGYHLKQAEMIEQFESFLNLRFIDHKIKIVGVNNTEQDLRTYREEIVNGSSDRREKLDKCIKFINDNKNELQNQLPEIDIIQLALPTLKDDAQTLMEENQENSINKLYFNMKLSAGRLKSSQKIFMKDVTVTAFCMDNNISKVLIGLKTGEVLLYCSHTKKEIDRFVGHKDSVYDIKVANDNSSFLSVSNDRTVKLWQFFSQRASFDGTVPKSPKYVQTGYIDAFSPDRINKFKNFRHDEDGSYLVAANFANNFREVKRIVTGSNDGRIVLWNAFTRERLFATAETGFPVGNLQFSGNNDVLMFSKQENAQIYRCDNDKLTHYDSIHNAEDIVKLFLANDDTLIVIGAKLVLMYKLPYEDNSMCSKVFESALGEQDITCSAIADGGDYFAVGIGEKVLLFSVSSGKLVETLEHNRKVASLAVDVFKVDDNETSTILMNFHDNDNIQMSHIMMEHYARPRNKQGLVTSYWKNTNLPMLALVHNETVLKIQHEFTTINEVQRKEKISFITFSLCGNNIIFSLDNGEIVEYQYKRKDCFKVLMTLKDPVKFLQCFNLGLGEDNANGSYNSSDSCDNGAIVAVTNFGDKNNVHVFMDGELREFSWDTRIFHVFPTFYRHRILCVDVAGGVFTVDVSKTNKNSVQTICYATWCRDVNSAAFSPNRNLLAITFRDQNSGKDLLEITDVFKRETVKEAFLPLGCSPKCCAFSHLGGLFAVGCEGGKIIVYDRNDKGNFSRHQILTDQGESQSDTPIRFVQFSNDDFPILVAVGKEISWWNLSELEMKGNNNGGNNRNGDFDIDFWRNKTVHDDIPFLLQTVNLYGNAVHFSVSKNFEKFLVVDDEGRINVMECFKDIKKKVASNFVF